MIVEVKEVNNEPTICIVGSDLLKWGFELGDVLRVEFSNNQILIQKSKNTKLLNRMQAINPSIRKLLKEFDLELLTE